MNLEFFCSHTLGAVIFSFFAVAFFGLSLVHIFVDRHFYEEIGGSSKNLFLNWAFRYVLGFVFIFICAYNPPFYHDLSFVDLLCCIGLIIPLFYLFSDFSKESRNCNVKEGLWYFDAETAKTIRHHYMREAIVGRISLYAMLSSICLFLLLFGEKLFG